MLVFQEILRTYLMDDPFLGMFWLVTWKCEIIPNISTDVSKASLKLDLSAEQFAQYEKEYLTDKEFSEWILVTNVLRKLFSSKKIKITRKVEIVIIFKRSIYILRLVWRNRGEKH